MADSLRDLIAETLAQHRIGLRGVGTWQCSCGTWSGTRGRDVPHEFVKADYERHVADVILAALGERVLPEGSGHLQRDCPGQDCRRHAPGEHTHERYVGTWLPIEHPVDTEETPA